MNERGSLMNVTIRRRNKKKYRDWVLWLLLLPSLMGMLIFYLLPFFLSMYYAMIDNVVSHRFVGLQNFIDTFHNLSFQQALKNTAFFILVGVPLNLICSFTIASLLKKVTKLKVFFGLIFLIPMIIPAGAVVFVWKSIFDVNGILNWVLYSVGLPMKNWLESEWVLGIVIIIFLWKNIGIGMILFWTGLIRIPKTYYEMARVEGGGAMGQLFHITLVYIMPTGFVAALLSIINSFKIFKEIFLLFGNYPSEWVYLLQHYMNNQFLAANAQKLSASAGIISAFIISVLFFFFHSQRKLSEHFS